MRKMLALATFGVAVAAAVLPVQSASAVCIESYYQLTGDCSPCNTIADLTGRPMNCVA